MSLANRQFTPEQIAALRQTVRERLLHDAPYARQPNFIRLSPQDLLILFRLYDAHFFDHQLQPLVMQAARVPVQFRVSRAMTNSGGRTTWYRQSGITTRFVISIGTSLLFNSFREDSRPILVSGQPCTDRLDALMRIMEHEIIHLLEMLVFQTSSCARTRFLTIANRIFGHTHPKHQLVTAREHAAREHKIHVGQKVRFSFEQKEFVGIVNRIGLRATILVPDSRARRYSDGRLYTKFLIPPARLDPL